MTHHFDEIYTGPLFIADRILLSHEPIETLPGYIVNIHGHVHNGAEVKINDNNVFTYLNLASDVVNFTVFNLGKFVKKGGLSNVENYHRRTIDEATERKTT